MRKPFSSHILYLLYDSTRQTIEHSAIALPLFYVRPRQDDRVFPDPFLNCNKPLIRAI